ncbi:hypothetical protein NXH67_10795 [Butyrivibrio sp. DSM 10294]|uniref:hypothetical protein n=1 Tax=Butyrivibrio sp. DSM 10294 TaxID=2972457 RepID=UPI00234F5E17|nr:hypothetical protein [Butyrivibrio sp. DSM 10294]MDC7294002.1 hypothetical protein [Butyrivibrio sp. DSM 10294]
MTTVIRATLSVVLHLVDTTTGRDVDDTNVRFTGGETTFKPMFKGDGNWVFIGLGKEDFLMHIKAEGYDETDVSINYGTLDPRLPVIDVFLMPSEKNRSGGSVLEIYGTLPKLEHIEAINLMRPICGFSAFTEKRGKYILSFLPRNAGGRINLECMKYALLSETKERYEVFEVLSTETQTSVAIRAPVDAGHKVNEMIYRIVYGRAGPMGEFSLKVRNDSDNLPYLIRFRAGDSEYFRPLDFHLERGETDLMKGAFKLDPLGGKEEEEGKNE